MFWEEEPTREAPMEWLLHLPVSWMSFIIFAAIYLIAAVVFWSATRLIGDGGRLVDPGLLSPLGVVFGLLIVFTAVGEAHCPQWLLQRRSRWRL